VIGYRHADPRFPFLWESSEQPGGRYHAAGEGPVTYLSDSPDGAWAEFLRHEEIVDAADLTGVRRRIWAVHLPDDEPMPVDVPDRVAMGGQDTYPRCRRAAWRLRRADVRFMAAPEAALLPGAAGGQRTDGGLREAGSLSGRTLILIGRWPALRGYAVVDVGRPTPRVLGRVRQLQ